MKFLNEGFDHVEFAVASIGIHQSMWERLGFHMAADQKIASKGARHVILAQGSVRILLTEYDESPAAQAQAGYAFLKAHGDGICTLAVEVEDTKAIYDQVVGRGAKPAMAPHSFESNDGAVVIAEVYTPADFRYRFVQRKQKAGAWGQIVNDSIPALFLDHLNISSLKSQSPHGIYRIDHLTNNIDMGQFETWLKFYTEIFGFKAVRRFNIKTGRTGLLSDVVQSECAKVKVPINEATEKESQVQEFVDRFKGAGVQHLALQTRDIVSSLKSFKAAGFKFLSVPETYYKKIPTRIPGVKEDLKLLEELQILLDGEGGGYLMQVFSQELVGPFFLEFIERKGNDGFGEGNFKALFEAIESDQIARGVLKV